ncbi:DDE_3 domain-containing protein [Nephila pilipes]|uniref:DDE_3 domain-containing protein n=1 Tax=Nephila pilipes TaxID=299642 RepID=A0A8X6TJK9_NEPPI|nr:DDE_3 domain-containing protein [Nephila pilipes]
MVAPASLGPLVHAEHILRHVGYLNTIENYSHPYIASVFSTWNGVFQRITLHAPNVKIALQKFEEHADEYLLMLWKSNNLDLNFIEKFRDVMEQLLRDQRPLPWNIEKLRDSCLNI